MVIAFTGWNEKQVMSRAARAAHRRAVAVAAERVAAVLDHGERRSGSGREVHRQPGVAHGHDRVACARPAAAAAAAVSRFHVAGSMSTNRGRAPT